MAPATPPTTGPTTDSVGAGDAVVVSDDAEVVVGGDVESVVEDVSEPLVGGAVGGAVVGGVVVGGAVVGGTLGLGVGVTLTSEKGSMTVLPLPLATIEVVLGRLGVLSRLVVVVRVGVIVGLGVVVRLAEADELRMMVLVWPRQERREKQETDSV